jgi:hypothetical protein
MLSRRDLLSKASQPAHVPDRHLPETAAGVMEHMVTWQEAYNIESIRE